MSPLSNSGGWVKVGVVVGAGAEQLVEFLRVVVIRDVLGAGDDLEAAVFLTGGAERKFAADSEGRVHDTGKGGGFAVAMPTLVE